MNCWVASPFKDDNRDQIPAFLKDEVRDTRADVVGYQSKNDDLTKLPVEERPDQTGCFVGWRTVAKGEIPDRVLAEKGNSVCVNPLTWTTSEQWASSDLHKGMGILYDASRSPWPFRVDAVTGEWNWLREGGWQEDCHTDVIHNFMDALKAVPEWVNSKTPDGKVRKEATDYFPKPRNGKIYVIAHRGAHVGIPENSLPAIQKAIDLGCDFVEIDTRMTKDGHIVSVHNASVDEYVSGVKGKVKDFTLEEIKKLDIGEKTGTDWKNTRIPTIEEILQLCRGQIGIYLDLKEPLVAELLPIIHKYGMERDIIWYIPASHMDLIEQLKSLCSKCFPMPDPGQEKNIQEVTNQIHPVVLASSMGQLNESFVKTAHANRTKVFVDENKGTPTEWNQIIDWGTDGIQTDDPEALLEFLKSIN